MNKNQLWIEETIDLNTGKKECRIYDRPYEKYKEDYDEYNDDELEDNIFYGE